MFFRIAWLVPVVLALAGCDKTPPPSVAATVNNSPITFAEIDRIHEAQLSTPGEASDDLVQIQKLEILRSLVEREIMFQRAEKLGLLATDAEVDAKFNQMKAPYTQEELQKQLDARKMTVNDWKVQLRRDLSIEKFINKEITARITITEKEIADFYEANKANFNRAEPAVHLAQIVVTAAADQGLRNLRNDDARSDEQARKKIEMIANRLKEGEDFAMLAENYSEDVNSAPNGGDLGSLPMSAFDGSSPEFRKLIGAMQPGQFSPILPGQQEYRIFKVIEREPAGQRELNDPRVQQAIRQGLLGRKEQLLRHAYLETARNEARVVNYYAQRVIESKSK